MVGFGDLLRPVLRVYSAPAILFIVTVSTIGLGARAQDSDNDQLALGKTTFPIGLHSRGSTHFPHASCEANSSLRGAAGRNVQHWCPRERAEDGPICGYGKIFVEAYGDPLAEQGLSANVGPRQHQYGVFGESFEVSLRNAQSVIARIPTNQVAPANWNGQSRGLGQQT